MIDRGYEDLAVADLPGARVRGDDLNRLVRKLGGDRDFDPQLGQKIHDIFGAAIDFGVTLLTAIAFDLGHSHAVHTDGRQRLADLVQLEGFDDRDDEFHGRAFVLRRFADWQAQPASPKPNLASFRANGTKNLQARRKTFR